MTKQLLIELCTGFSDAEVVNPFKDKDICAVRHTDNKKWFALIINLKGELCVNLKCDPLKADFLRSIHSGIIAGYHMNKTHWNTVLVNKNVDISLLNEMIGDSYALTNNAKKT